MYIGLDVLGVIIMVFSTYCIFKGLSEKNIKNLKTIKKPSKYTVKLSTDYTVADEYQTLDQYISM